MSSNLPPVSSAAPSPRATSPSADGPGVLVVDDEKPVRTMLRTWLEQHGFRVWLAADGAEAVAAYRENGAAIAVVLLDVRMPGMDGPHTLEALRLLNGDLVACFMSGNLGTYTVDDLLRRGARHVFPKPVGLEELAETLWSLVPAPVLSQLTRRAIAQHPNSARADRSPPPRRPENSVPLRVLVIDDDADDRASFRHTLERDGCVAEAVGTVAVALDRAGRGPYGAIILDHRLPGETTEDIMPRLLDRFPDTPVLVALWQTHVIDAGRVLRLGAADYLLKPIDPDEVRLRVRRIVGHRRALVARAQAGMAWARTETELQQKEEELRATTRQLWQAARLAGIGELAASIAHELNNPLGTVSLRIEGLLTRTPPDDPRRHALEVIDEEVERMGKLVGNLLRFSRSGAGVSTLDVRDEVTQTLELIAHHLRKWQVQVTPEFTSDVPVIHADRQQLRQVLLNLFTNAVDSMPDGGRLIPRVRASQLPGGLPAVVIEVADSGCGIPADVLPRVTEPFFTTKDEGKGTGLGLSVCKKLVEQHQGTLEVESTVGVGTTIRVTLPARVAEPRSESQSE